jgi:hypothetical protein
MSASGSVTRINAQEELNTFYAELKRGHEKEFEQLEKQIGTEAATSQKFCKLVEKLAADVILVGPKKIENKPLHELVQVEKKAGTWGKFWHGVMKVVCLGFWHRRNVYRLESALNAVRTRTAVVDQPTKELLCLQCLLNQIITRANEVDPKHPLRKIIWTNEAVANRAEISVEEKPSPEQIKLAKVRVGAFLKIFESLKKKYSEQLKPCQFEAETLKKYNFKKDRNLPKLVRDFENAFFTMYEELEESNQLYKNLFPIAQACVNMRQALEKPHAKAQPPIEQEAPLAEPKSLKEWMKEHPPQPIVKPEPTTEKPSPITTEKRDVMAILAKRRTPAERTRTASLFPGVPLVKKPPQNEQEKAQERAQKAKLVEKREKATLQITIFLPHYRFIQNTKDLIEKSPELTPGEQQKLHQYLDKQSEALNQALDIALKTAEVTKTHGKITRDLHSKVADILAREGQKIRKEIEALYKSNTNELDPVRVRQALGLEEAPKLQEEPESVPEAPLMAPEAVPVVLAPRLTEKEQTKIASLLAYPIPIFVTLLLGASKSSELLTQLSEIGFCPEKTLADLIKNETLSRYEKLIQLAREKKLAEAELKELETLDNDLDEEFGELNKEALVRAADELIRWCVNNKDLNGSFTKRVEHWLRGMYEKTLIDKLFSQKSVEADFQFSDEFEDLFTTTGMQKNPIPLIKTLLGLHKGMKELLEKISKDTIAARLKARRQAVAPENEPEE